MRQVGPFGVLRTSSRYLNPQRALDPTGYCSKAKLTPHNRAGLLTLLASQLRLGAYIGLSGWLPFAAQLEKQQPLDLAHFFEATLGLQIESVPTHDPLNTPVFLGHTSDDEVIDVQLGQQTRSVLEKMEMAVTWTEHRHGGHLGFLATKGLDDIVAFLKELHGRR